jgi:alpha-ketoglutarate-dependent taurine dioxygenase
VVKVGDRRRVCVAMYCEVTLRRTDSSRGCRNQCRVPVNPRFVTQAIRVNPPFVTQAIRVNPPFETKAIRVNPRFVTKKSAAIRVS